LGHQIFEGRSPALLKDPAQGNQKLLNTAFILSPFFVFCQYLFMYKMLICRFGYFKKEKKRLNDKTVKAVLKYRKSLQKLSKFNLRKVSEGVVDIE
jgi:uncharacterized membrane protein YGL010W